ncbi:MAG: metalloregulator ArsR/SmtB family transcription factor [Patescibacteria group bacterium]|nr:metalloregulator ArsR/SmtB family transcription factor [Patescibacteria group bacterium]
MRNFRTKIVTKELAQKASMLSLAGEEARIRILCVLLERPGSCVSFISEQLNMSVAAVSHHLQLMHKGGLLQAQRQGKQVCYRLRKGKLISHLRKFICHEPG